MLKVSFCDQWMSDVTVVMTYSSSCVNILLQLTFQTWDQTWPCPGGHTVNLLREIVKSILV